MRTGVFTDLNRDGALNGEDVQVWTRRQYVAHLTPYNA